MKDYFVALHDNVKVSNDFIHDVTDYASDYQDSTRALGGFWTGGFTLRRPLPELEEWFNHFIGYRIVRSVGGIVFWEGLISQMRLTSGGQTYVRDVNTMVNRAQVLYTDTTGGSTLSTAWSTNGLSLSQYGQREETFTFDGSTSAMAAAYRDTQLAEYAYPRARGAGGELFGEIVTDPVLSIQTSGYVFTMNWRYVTTSNAAQVNASAFITTLVGESEFVTAGIIETNTTQVPQRFLSPTRVWDGIERVVKLGDANGIRYVTGVGAGRKLYYRAAATGVTYHQRGGRLYHLDGSDVLPGEVQADRIARRADAPTGQSTSDFLDPRNMYIEQADFIAPGTIQVRASEWTFADILQARLEQMREAERG